MARARQASEPTTCQEAEPFALRVLDDSMTPEFDVGCIIIIDPSGVARDGAFVLARCGDAHVFRQLRSRGDGWCLVALNDAYPALAVRAGAVTIQGVIVERAGTRRHYHKRYD